MSVPLQVLIAPDGAGVAELSVLLRTLVASADDVRRHAGAAAADAPARVTTWAVLGEATSEPGTPVNAHVVDHDRVGRQAVRLAVDKVLCVGSSRAVRALHQGAVMEGSWGDEARLVTGPAAAVDAVTTDPDWTPRPGDQVLLAGVPAADLLDRWRDIGLDVELLAPGPT
ncbi:MAG: UDP-N-acetylmuramoyl-tripeptide--D-alanyl-D-alanine ligase [Gordonia sp. (in: high G+C Gram-positive bacteria)]